MFNKRWIREFIRNHAGVDIVRYSATCHPLARRASLIKNYGIDLVFDVGANAGQFGQQLRSIGYKGRIVSFEPLSTAYQQLVKNAKKDDLWTAFNFALGSRSITSTINVSRNSYSSSLSKMLPSHLAAAPWSDTVGTEPVAVKTLDSVMPTDAEGASILLKIDTQGSEMDVLRGAEGSMPCIDTIQVEMSLAPLYENDTLLPDMIQHLSDQGYQLVGLEPGFTDRASGRLLQADGIFHKHHSRSA